jgi:ribose transport system substrate-binding protein
MLAAVLVACWWASSSATAATHARVPRASANAAASCPTYNPTAAKILSTLPAGLPCPTKHNYTIGILAVGVCPYCSALSAAYKEEAAALGVKLNVLNANLKADLQSQQMDQMIAQHPNIIVAVPVDTKALIPGIAKAKAAGIPVVDATIRIDPSGYKYVVGYIGINDTLAGKLCADLMIKGLHAKGNKSGKVAIVAGTPGGSSVLRTRGFQQEMAKKAPQYKLLAPQYTDFTKAEGLSTASSIISRNGSNGLVGIWAEDDTLVSGVAEAASQAGLTHKLVMVGMNGNRAGISLVKSGAIYGTVLQQPTIDGSWSLLYAVDVLEHKNPGSFIALTQPLITKTNVAKYSPGW